MNLEEYQTLKQEISNFDELYVEEVPISRIAVSDNSQVRLAKGHRTDAIPRMSEQLSALGQLAPITVKALTPEIDELKEGNTRYFATKRNRKSTILVSRYHDKVKFKTEAEWFKWQIKMNEHLQVSQNSEEDLTSQIFELHSRGIISKDINIRYLDSPKEYISEAVRFLRKDIYTNFSDYQIQSRLEKAVQTTDVPENFYSFNKDLALDHFDEYNNVGWNPESPTAGAVSNSIAVYAAESPGNIRKDVLPNAITKKKKNPNTKIYLISTVGNLAGFDEYKVVKARKKFLDEYEFYNIKIDFGDGPQDLFSGIYFCPQIKSVESRRTLLTKDQVQNA